MQRRWQRTSVYVGNDAGRWDWNEARDPSSKTMVRSLHSLGLHIGRLGMLSFNVTLSWMPRKSRTIESGEKLAYFTMKTVLGRREEEEEEELMQ